jgi:hypothetical protein
MLASYCSDWSFIALLFTESLVLEIVYLIRKLVLSALYIVVTLHERPDIIVVKRCVETKITLVLINYLKMGYILCCLIKILR